MHGSQTLSLAQRVETILNRHGIGYGFAPRNGRDGGWSCACGARGRIPLRGGTIASYHRAHAAEMVARDLEGTA